MANVFIQDTGFSFINIISKCRNKLNELFTNIKMIKSFTREKEEVKEYEKYLYSMQKSVFENHKILIFYEITVYIWDSLRENKTRKEIRSEKINIFL